MIYNGDLVAYFENKMYKGLFTCVKVISFGIWDGEKVQLNDTDKTIVRKKEYLIKIPDYYKKYLYYNNNNN